jgi:hypothetical protein
MYFFRILIRPNRKNKEYGKVSGAYASCWVNRRDVSAAKKTILEQLNKWSWDVKKVEAVLLSRSSDYNKKDKSLFYYREARENGLSVLLHKWPTKRAHLKKNGRLKKKSKYS